MSKRRIICWRVHHIVVDLSMYFDSLASCYYNGRLEETAVAAIPFHFFTISTSNVVLKIRAFDLLLSASEDQFSDGPSGGPTVYMGGGQQTPAKSAPVVLFKCAKFALSACRRTRSERRNICVFVVAAECKTLRYLLYNRPAASRGAAGDASPIAAQWTVIQRAALTPRANRERWVQASALRPAFRTHAPNSADAHCSGQGSPQLRALLLCAYSMKCVKCMKCFPQT